MPPRRDKPPAVHIGELRYLLSLVTYPTEAVLGERLGTSARYIRWMLSGKKPGRKHAALVHSLYEDHRRRGTPQVLKRLAKRKRGFVPTESVIAVLRAIFQPTDTKVLPNMANRKWQDRGTRFLTFSRSIPPEAYDTWDSFFIVLVTGSTSRGDTMVRKYKPRPGVAAADILELDDDPEESQDRLADDLAAAEEAEAFAEVLAARYAALPRRAKEVVSHLPIDRWISEIAELAWGESLVHFRIARESERATPTEGRATPPRAAFAKVEEMARAAVADINSESDHFMYYMVGVYAYTGWNRVTFTRATPKPRPKKRIRKRNR